MNRVRTGIYVDALNFYYGALKGGPDKWLDLEAFSKRLLPHDNIVCIRYFTAIVNSRPDDPRIPVRQETYLRALATLQTVSIHRGRFTTRVRTKVLADAFEHFGSLFSPHFRPQFLFSLMWKDKVYRRTDTTTRVRVVVEEEKGSDVNLAAYLVNDAARKNIDKALVISNDSDLTDAIALARNFDIQVGILNPHSGATSKHLRTAASFQLPFRRSILADSQFPVTVLDQRNREIHKPREWRHTQRPGLAAGP